MSEQDNVKIAHAAFDAFNQHDLSQWAKNEADNYVFVGPVTPGPMNGDQGRAYAQNFINAFPDLRFEVMRTIADGDFVVVNWIGRGTHTGPLGAPSGSAIPPTHKHAMVHGSNTYQFKNGKLVHNQVYWDMAGLLAQLGLMPPM
jgi:steroid delta-isomerase-like uncharacterized protein